LFVDSEDETEKLVNTRKLSDKLRSHELPLGDVFAACRHHHQGRRVLFVADQFEECFTLVENQTVRSGFIDLLIGGFPDPTNGTSPDICLIVTLRADFYGRALRHRPLADALQGHIENLGPMNRKELEAAIVKPAESLGVSFAPGLVHRILEDVTRAPGGLPLLQFALREIWGSQQNGQITSES
jgi:hypothetical protein